MTDDDDTPRVRLPSDEERQEHYRQYPPGTPPVRTEIPMLSDPDPDYRTDPNERLIVTLERVLERELPAQRQLLAAQQEAINSLTASRDTGRKVLWLVIPALVGALATVLVFAAEKVATSSERAGKLEATVDALKDRIAGQESEIGQLRGVLLRLGAGGDPHKPTSGPDPAVHDDRYGVIDPQWPNAHRPQPVCGRIWHSVLVEHTSLHDRGWISSSMKRAASIDSGISGALRGMGGGSGGSVPHAAMTMMTITRAMDRIPYL